MGEIPNLVGWSDTRSFGELENLFVDLGNMMRSLASTALDDALQVFDQHVCADAADREFSQPGGGIELKALPHRAGVLRILD
nr:hypothetical protein [Pseudomonas sp. S5D5]